MATLKMISIHTARCLTRSLAKQAIEPGGSSKGPNHKAMTESFFETRCAAVDFEIQVEGSLGLGFWASSLSRGLSGIARSSQVLVWRGMLIEGLWKKAAGLWKTIEKPQGRSRD